MFHFMSVHSKVILDSQNPYFSKLTYPQDYEQLIVLLLTTDHDIKNEILTKGESLIWNKSSYRKQEFDI